MRAAKAHGTKTGNAIGRPRRIFNRDEVVRLRGTGLSIEKIADQMSIGVGTVVRVLQSRPAWGAAAGLTFVCSNSAFPGVFTPVTMSP